MTAIRHIAVVVTTWSEPFYALALGKAQQLGLPIAGYQMAPVINGYRSFLVCSHGSKSGWAEGDEGDRRRVEFVEFLRSLAHGDGSSSIDWVEVAYGNDDRSATLTDHAWRKQRRPLPCERCGADMDLGQEDCEACGLGGQG